jgi:enoyl-CoA hydratase
MDLKAFAAGEDIDTRRLPIALPVQQIISKPIIGAIEGYALGAGFELALACDLLIASQLAKFGLTEVKRGLVAGGGGVMRLVRQMPPRLAAEMILTGNMVEAAELGKWGLINRIVANETALTEAMTLASVIAANAPLAVAASTRLMRESPEWPAADMFARQNLITEPVFLTADAREGAMAFAEKRAPHWSGC